MHPARRFTFPPDEVLASVPEECKEQELHVVKCKQIIHHLQELAGELEVCRRASPGRMDTVAQEYMEHVKAVVDRQGKIIELAIGRMNALYERTGI